jgi:hypothetical protein
MSITLSEQLEWSGNNWITRTFLRETVPFLDAAPELRDLVHYSVASEIEMFDLTRQPTPVFKGLLRLVSAVLMFHDRTHGEHFDEPDYFYDYVNSLRQLKRLLQERLVAD